MFDFHLHLARFTSPLTVVKGLLDEGTGFNSIACEPWEWEKNLNLELSGENIHYTFGIHPMIATQASLNDLERLEKILQSNADFAVGECGLDKRFEGYEAGGNQEKILIRQITLARRLNRSLQIHCVGDYGRLLHILQDIFKGENRTSTSPTSQVVFHRFGGDISVVKSALKLFGNSAIFSLHADSFRKKSTTAAIKEIPAEQVRFETDADDESWTAESIITKLREIQQLHADLLRKK